MLQNHNAVNFNMNIHIWNGEIIYMGEMRDPYKFLILKPEGNRPFKRRRHCVCVCVCVCARARVCVKETQQHLFVQISLHLLTTKNVVAKYIRQQTIDPNRTNRTTNTWSHDSKLLSQVEVLWVVRACSDVARYRRFGEPSSGRWIQSTSPKLLP
jgi:hypothetical protein